jgi:hypothetical protein
LLSFLRFAVACVYVLIKLCVRCAMVCAAYVEHMNCNSHVHIINVMMTRSRKVRSGTHIAVDGLGII